MTESESGSLRATLSLDTEIPWLAGLQRSLSEAIDADRLGHAVLIQVDPGLGGEWLATWLAARLFCSAASGTKPCGACLDCRRVVSGEQPDLMRLSPIEESKEIRIDQVREMAAELALTGHGRGRKIALITPAERLNRNAANALLKTLEEPAGSSLLLLVTGEPSRLPATVQSRCTRVGAPVPPIAELESWLRARGGKGIDWKAVMSAIGLRPVTALQVEAEAIADLQRETARALDQVVSGALDPVETAETWGKDDFALRITCIENWIVSRIREWASGKRAGQADALFAALDDAREARQWAETPINKPLALERLLWRLSAIATSRRPA
jgi:DNA polymerase-3 subunit delta'